MSGSKSKQKRNRSQRKSNTSPRTPATEPTAKQLKGLDELKKANRDFSKTLGPPEVDGAPTAVAPTLEESLKKATALVAETHAHLRRAREREEAAKGLEQGLDRARGELETMRAELIAQRAEIEAREREQAAVCEQQRTREAELAEKSARMAEREANAERSFLAEKLRVFKPLDEELEKLRSERTALSVELRERRSRVAAEERERDAARSEKWRVEDQQRAELDASARAALTKELTQNREEELARLHEQLQVKRVEFERALETELAARRTEYERKERAQRERLAEQHIALDERERQLEQRELEQRRAENQLRVERELFEEDKAANDKKVVRLVQERSEDIRHSMACLEKNLADARARRDEYFDAIEAGRELDRRFEGKTTEEVLSELKLLRRERDELRAQLLQRPDAGASQRLIKLERERSSWSEERATLDADLAQARAELAKRRLAAIELETLVQEKEALGAQNQLLCGALDELKATVDELTRQDERRNPMAALSSIDDDPELKVAPRTSPPLGRATPTLKAFAADLRHRVARGITGRTLYYSDRDIRSFLGGLAMTRLVLLQGISGTGKTSLPLAFASAVGGEFEVVEVQAGWRDRQDLIGYYNAFHRHYYATNFLQALYRAGTPKFRDRVFLMVLDEINLSRPEQFFADFISALEQPQERRRLTLVSDPITNAPRLLVEGRHLPIPPNVWFVGTANHDESTAEFADKTYDRALVMEMPRKTEAAQFDVEDRRERLAVSFDALERCFNTACEHHARTVEHAIQWLRGASFVETLEERFRVGWGNRMEQQLTRYLPVVVEAGGTVGEAMDHLLATKVLRKLKDRHDVRASTLEVLREELREEWKKLDGALLKCEALISKEIYTKRDEELS